MLHRHRAPAAVTGSHRSNHAAADATMPHTGNRAAAATSSRPPLQEEWCRCSQAVDATTRRPLAQPGGSNCTRTLADACLRPRASHSEGLAQISPRCARSPRSGGSRGACKAFSATVTPATAAAGPPRSSDLVPIRPRVLVEAGGAGGTTLKAPQAARHRLRRALPLQGGRPRKTSAPAPQVPPETGRAHTASHQGPFVTAPGGAHPVRSRSKSSGPARSGANMQRPARPTHGGASPLT